MVKLTAKIYLYGATKPLQVLRQFTATIAQEDHAGITRTKQRLRSKLRWPKMDTAVEEYIKCHACQATGGPSRQEPVKPTELPCERWSSLAINICGPFPSGEYLVTLIDYHSRWPEAKIMKAVTSRIILAWLDDVFATHGYPKQIKADNACYFKSSEFYSTLKSWGLAVKYVTEYWPQANGLVERFNKVFLKHVQTSLVEGKVSKTSLPTLLRNYRSTPHGTTGETPSQLIMLINNQRKRERNMLMHDEILKQRTFNQENMF